MCRRGSALAPQGRTENSSLTFEDGLYVKYKRQSEDKKTKKYVSLKERDERCGEPERERVRGGKGREGEGEEREEGREWRRREGEGMCESFCSRQHCTNRLHHFDVDIFFLPKRKKITVDERITCFIP